MTTSKATAPDTHGSEPQEPLLLDGWLSHTASTMSIVHDTAHDDNPLKRGLAGWLREVEDAAKIVAVHNANILAICGDKSRCGWKPYPGKRCPSCPMEYLLEWPHENQR